MSKQKRRHPLSIIEGVDLDFKASIIYDEVYAKYADDIQKEVRKRIRQELGDLLPIGTVITFPKGDTTVNSSDYTTVGDFRYLIFRKPCINIKTPA
ncbi:hypothetical protein COB64_02430 [Candidatus Wolfebacteria bacterium]|nr:MAG: hypothetical protein COB64_02430 [Candidatus Wolfebacteria bacterium]